MKRLVSIIIPTTASAQRSPLLSRALLSLLNDQDEMVIPIVVVNGSRYVPEVLESLRRRRDIRFVHLDEGSATGARLAGREVVDTEFFGMLDDDDEYLPGAVKTRLGPLLRDESIDVVVTNGYRRDNDQDVVAFREFSTFGTDPLGHLMDYPWLNSAGGLYRTKSVGLSYFEVPPLCGDDLHGHETGAQQKAGFSRYTNVSVVRQHAGIVVCHRILHARRTRCDPPRPCSKSARAYQTASGEQICC